MLSAERGKGPLTRWLSLPPAAAAFHHLRGVVGHAAAFFVQIAPFVHQIPPFVHQIAAAVEQSFAAFARLLLNDPASVPARLRRVQESDGRPNRAARKKPEQFSIVILSHTSF